MFQKIIGAVSSFMYSKLLVSRFIFYNPDKISTGAFI